MTLSRAAILVRLADLWREQISLGTTQGGGRKYREHCHQHTEALELLRQLDASPLEIPGLGPTVGRPPPHHDFHADCAADPDLMPPVYTNPLDRVAISAGGVEFTMLPTQARSLAIQLMSVADWAMAATIHGAKEEDG